MPSIIHKKSVEGFGIAFVEAGQYGIPSIGGKDGGAADAIDDGKTGIIWTETILMKSILVLISYWSEIYI